jgi:hypothetical protein
MVKEGIWLKTFVKEVMGDDVGSLTVMADSQGAIALAKDNKFHVRTKHIDLCYHFIHEVVKNGKIVMKYIPMLQISLLRHCLEQNFWSLLVC